MGGNAGRLVAQGGRRRRAAVLGGVLVALVLPNLVGPALAETYTVRDPVEGITVAEVGTNGGDARAALLGVSQGGCADAEVAVAVGDPNRLCTYRGDADGNAAAVGVLGAETAAVVAATDTGAAYGECYYLGSLFGCLGGPGAAVSGTGSATGSVAVSGTGSASSSGALLDEIPQVAVSATGPASSSGVAVSGTGTASGGTTATGSVTRHSYVAFTGEANLPMFPCRVTDGCSAPFTGEWEGRASGVHGAAPYEVAWITTPGRNALSVTANYYENCIGDPTGLAQGHANGSNGFASSTSSANEVVGRYWPLPGAEPKAITGVELNFTFIWTRVGTSALLSLGEATKLILHIDGLPSQTVILGAQVGVAAFAARPTTVGVPLCATRQPNVHATVAGFVPLVDAD